MKLNSILLTFIIAFSPVLNAAFREDVTLHVPSEYATINDALYDLDEKTISKDVTVTIQVEDGAYTYDQSIVISHPDSDRIKIVGNASNPSSCSISFTGGSNGISIVGGKSLGYIDGFLFQGSNQSGSGLFVSESGSIELGTNIVIDGFSIGVYAAHNSHVVANSVTIRNMSNTGVLSDSGSHIIANSSSVSSCNYGVFANMNSSVQVDNATISNNTTGVFAANGSFIHTLGCSLSGNSTNHSPTPNTFGNWASYIRTQ